MLENALMPRATIDEIVRNRSHAIQLFRDGYETLRQAREVARMAAPQGFLPALPDNVKRLLENCNDNNADEYTDAMTRLVDQAVWDHIISAMGIEKLMDAQAREQFRHQLRTNPPEVSAENCRATMENLMLDAGTIFRRGIANAFSKLDRRFRTHDAFSIGSKIIFDMAFSEYGGWCRRTDDYLRDVERAFYVLDGKEMPERYAGIIGVIDDKRRELGGLRCHKYEVSNEYFRVKAFKNGNLHVWLLRDDLVEKVNKLLAEYYGATLGDASEEASSKSNFKRSAPAKNFGFFPTPDDLADRIIEEAYIRPGDTVLEPNAGTGALSRRALDRGGVVTCIEVQPAHVMELEQDSRYTAVLAMDFLELTPELVGQFDRIIMNPPFDRGCDIDHVDHALNFLAPGGLLVAIMSAGAEFRTDAKSVAFQKKVERLRGSFYDLPAGSFASVGTMVNTVVLTIRKQP